MPGRGGRRHADSVLALKTSSKGLASSLDGTSCALGQGRAGVIAWWVVNPRLGLTHLLVWFEIGAVARSAAGSQHVRGSCLCLDLWPAQGWGGGQPQDDSAARTHSLSPEPTAGPMELPGCPRSWFPSGPFRIWAPGARNPSRQALLGLLACPLKQPSTQAHQWRIQQFGR